VFLYIGNVVGSDWFSENVTLANRVSGACWAQRSGEEGRKLTFLVGAQTRSGYEVRDIYQVQERGDVKRRKRKYIREGK
jgi:hypothetical protein